MSKLLVICGPTATGKTSLGIKLAKKYNGEIVSADSRQVYQGMDVGTGKDLPVNSKFEIRNSKQVQNSKLKIPNYQIGYYLINGGRVWLYDIVEPDYQFSVADYVRCANLVIKDIGKRGKLPILVGGTGFYIKAVVDGIGTLGVPPDWGLREKLSNLEIELLREKLRRLDPGRLQKMNESDRQNPRRLIRAIEIAKQNQKPKTKNQKHKLKIKKVLLIGLKVSNKVLYERIDKRVDERVKQGVIGEIKRLLKMGYSWENSVLGTTMGYREWQEYFEESEVKSEKLKVKTEIIQKWKYDEHAYARRQMTWFRKDKRIRWVDISKKRWENRVEELVQKWYSKDR